MFGSLGLPELLIIFAIVLVVFGASRLPHLGKGLGEGIANFRDGLRGRDEKKTIEATALKAMFPAAPSAAADDGKTSGEKDGREEKEKAPRARGKARAESA